MRFLKKYNYSELDIEGRALVVQKLEVIYKKEVFYGETLTFSLGIGDFEKARVDLLYSVHNSNHVEICRAKTTLVLSIHKQKNCNSTAFFFVRFSKKAE